MTLPAKNLSLFFLAIAFFGANAQINNPGNLADPIEKLTDTTTVTFYKSISYRTDGFSIADPVFHSYLNTGYARSFNDGPVWRGNGITLSGNIGFQYSKGNFSMTLYPNVFYAQNRPYDEGDHDEPFGYPFSNRIDWVRRYGADGFVSLNLGQSEIKYDFGKVNASISTQNYSLGPSVFNPIIMSRQASGFPHVRLELEPTDLKVFKTDLGKIETNVMLGLLQESAYFDDNTENDRRYFNMLSVGYAPKFIPGLRLGFNKALYKQTQFFENTDVISWIYRFDDGVIDGDTVGLNDTFDQLASFTLEYRLPKEGLRIYTEFAKNDFTSDGNGLRPTLVEPEHTRGYTIGLEKVFSSAKEFDIWFNIEHTNLSRSQTPWRPTPSFYAHGINRQGYTENGQVIGAGIGLGGNADNVSVKAVFEESTIGILLQRIENNRDYFVDNIRNPNEHDMEYSINAFFSKSLESFELFGEMIFSHNYNRNYLKDDTNLAIGLGIRFKLSDGQ